MCFDTQKIVVTLSFVMTFDDNTSIIQRYVTTLNNQGTALYLSPGVWGLNRRQTLSRCSK